MAGNSYLLEVKPVIPERLSALTVLADNLLYSWQADIRALFVDLDRALWEECGHRPKVFLQRVQQQSLDAAAASDDYLAKYQRALEVYERYQKRQIPTTLADALNPDDDLIAYFCSEFGFHESLPIYSGGLGILAGDHCKAASDMGIPFVAVGLLYHQGYFTQTIDPDGQQQAHTINHNFAHLPVTLLTDATGEEIHTDVHLPGRLLTLRIWRVNIGKVSLYLLDSDIDNNSDEDRLITRQLYGAGHDTRIKQEIVLGIGGVKALRKVGLKPNIWHINEGHAAFQILQRCIESVAQGSDFDTSLEWVAASTVFTTHTPVAAGHDSFSRETMIDYFSEIAQALNLEFEKLLALGISNGDKQRFNMTSLALRGSRFHNGVSAIHGKIASEMESDIWPQIPPDENPITSVTNGIHVKSFLANKWVAHFDACNPNWTEHFTESDYARCIDTIADATYWQTHLDIKARLLKDVCQRLHKQHTRNELNQAFRRASVCHIQEKNPGNVLVMGFARRFATYKRATLIFSDRARLARLLNDPERPVIIIFAGKAHPSDEPGQQLIKDIHHLSEQAEFVGKIILLEAYDINLSRRLIAGTDIWLNTPIYPLEACGTSGQKAAVNGVLNLSVMDGWWAEGYNGDNGWPIEPHTEKYGADYRNTQEASDLLDIIEHQVIPGYFEREPSGLPAQWLAMSRSAMKSSITRFSAERMLKNYIEKLYSGAKRQNKRLSEDNLSPAKSLFEWKRKVAILWPTVSLRLIDELATEVKSGESWSIRIGVTLSGLSANDIVVELLEGSENKAGQFSASNTHPLLFDNTAETEAGELIYGLRIKPQTSGILHYKIRMYPYSDLLSHKFETGLMLWL